MAGWRSEQAPPQRDDPRRAAAPGEYPRPCRPPVPVPVPGVRAAAGAHRDHAGSSDLGLCVMASSADSPVIQKQSERADEDLASVLTSGSLDVQNGSQCAEGSGPVTEAALEPQDQTSPSSAAGNLQQRPVGAALTSRRDALSINGKKPEVGGTSEPASQETGKIGGFRQPITVKTGVPVLRSQPIRIKIVVPPRCKRPITNSAISLTKDFARSHFRRPVLLSAGAKRRSKIHLSAVKDEAQIMEVTYHKTEEGAEEMEAQRGEKKCKETDVLDFKIVHFDGSQAPFISSSNAVKLLSQQRVKEETAEREVGRNVPLILRETDLKSCFEEEQTEPLDLSLPKRRESRERRCGRFLEDSGAESSLIMESLLSPSSFSTSVFTSLSSADCDTESLLLIDDQGIPYTLSPDGLKVPQVDASTSEESDQAKPAEPEAELSEASSPQKLQTLRFLRIRLRRPSCHLPPSPSRSSPTLRPAPPSSCCPPSSPPPRWASPCRWPPPSTSTPIAVLDPSTGQLSQITAASAPVSLPLASPLPHPVIRLSPSNPPVILNSSVVAVSSSSSSLQDEHRGAAQISYSESNPGTEAMSAEDDENKPFPASPPLPAGSDPAQPASEPEVQSPASDSRFDPSDLPSEHLPLDDHLYFSSTAPPSPPIGPLFSSGKLDPLDPLDPLSPGASPNNMGSRRVLYCQLCPRVFFYLSDLERHAITHSQKKPHVCQQCGKAFKRSSHLQI
nr:PREDICTED: zinc finger protein 524 [Stegastes partitus]